VGLVTPLLPWLAILSLLALKPNHGWAAWWIWLPPVCVAAGCRYLAAACQNSPGGLPSEAVEAFLNVPVALTLGLAALWLLAPYASRRGLLGTFLGSLVILSGFTLFSFVARAGWALGTEAIMSLLDPRHCAATTSAGLEAMPLLVPAVLPTPVIAAAMALCGLACRGRYRPLALWLWLFVSLLVVWAGVTALFDWLCYAATGGREGYDLFLGLGLQMWLVSFMMLLPFLILSAASPLFRERLKGLLHVEREAPEPEPVLGNVPAAAP
jgi:hypothetical protein